MRVIRLENCVLLEAPAATVWSDPRVPESVRRRIAADPERFLRAAAGSPEKISRQTLLLQAELPLAGDAVSVAVKQYNLTSLQKSLAASFRPPQALRNWAKAEFLRRRDIATPQPLLACRMRRGPLAGSSFLVSQWIAGGENLHLFGWRLAARPVAERLRAAAACAAQAGQLIGRMHAAGAAHRDLKAANLLVVAGEEGPQVWLVDLDGLQIGRTIDMPRQARDLGRLAAGLAAHPWITPSIGLRFLRAYLVELGSDVTDWKPLWRMIAAQSMHIIRRKQRRGERVL